MQRLRGIICSKENFGKGIVLRFNLGPMHLLDGFVGEVLALDATKPGLLNPTWDKQSTLVTKLWQNISASIGSLSQGPKSVWMSVTHDI